MGDARLEDARHKTGRIKRRIRSGSVGSSPLLLRLVSSSLESQMQFKDGLDELVGEVVFGGEGEGFAVVGKNEEDFIVIRVEADSGLGDVIGDDEVAAFAGEFGAGVFLKVFRFRSEADEGAGESEWLAGGAKDVRGLDQLEGEGFAGLLDFFRSYDRWCVVGHGGGEDGHVHASDVMADGAAHFSGGFHGQEVDVVRDIKRGGA